MARRVTGLGERLIGRRKLMAGVATGIELTQGSIIWANLDPTLGKEYSGHRPALVISSADYLSLITDLVVVLPITSVNWGWSNHLKVRPPSLLNNDSWIVTEQPRTISRHRITRVGGIVDAKTFETVEQWLDIFLKTPRRHS